MVWDYKNVHRGKKMVKIKKESRFILSLLIITMLSFSVVSAINLDLNCPTDVTFVQGGFVECKVLNPDTTLGLVLMSLTVDGITGGGTIETLEKVDGVGDYALFSNEPLKSGFAASVDFPEKGSPLFTITLKMDTQTPGTIDLSDVVIKTADGGIYSSNNPGEVTILNNQITFASVGAICPSGKILNNGICTIIGTLNAGATCESNEVCSSGVCTSNLCVTDTTTTVCTDNDVSVSYPDGRDVYTASSASSTSGGGGGGGLDSCVDGNIVREGVCIGNVLTLEEISCPDGFSCDSGACITDTPTILDSDGDGILDNVDNCVNVANGDILGSLAVGETFDYITSGTDYEVTISEIADEFVALTIDSIQDMTTGTPKTSTITTQGVELTVEIISLNQGVLIIKINNEELTVTAGTSITYNSGSKDHTVVVTMLSTANLNALLTVNGQGLIVSVGNSYNLVDETSFGVSGISNEGVVDFSFVGLQLDTDEDGIGDACEVIGCTDNTADNYDAEAQEDDGSCTYTIVGCMDTTASNYNVLATIDEGCEYTCTTNEECVSPSSCVDNACVFGITQLKVEILNVVNSIGTVPDKISQISVLIKLYFDLN
jgi:hypothetical protein